MSNADMPVEDSPSGGSPRGLIDEIEGYLDAIALFRDLGCEPTWRREPGSEGPVLALIAPYVDHVSPV